MTHPTRKLGRRPAKNAPALRFADIRTGAPVPPHPAQADHFARVDRWILGQNDRYGTCGPTSYANYLLLTSMYLTDSPYRATDGGNSNDVFDLYRRAGNPDFDPATGNGDNGVDMQTMLEAARRARFPTQAARPELDLLAFAKVDHTNPEELAAAVAIFGAVLDGADLARAQVYGQFDAGVWSYDPDSPEAGGHAFMGGRYRPGRHGVITWQTVVDCDDSFVLHQLAGGGEVWVPILRVHTGTRQFQEGIDQRALADDLGALTGAPFPAVTPPAPGPAPRPAPAPVDPADRALAPLAREWLTHRRIGANAHLAAALRTWLLAKGL